ncbi:MAG: PAS domain S-box protein [Sedimentisphaerales bacterium]|nr:PAS domain S-box protein [Sedimentisphaerales bacterium]
MTEQGSNPQAIKILIIEDDLIDRKSLQRLLAKSSLADAVVETADSLGQAKEALKKGGFDIVLSDLGLPDSHGMETIRALRSLVPELPLVVLSGLDDEATAIQALQQGVQDYLIKGRVDSQLLGRSIRYAMERKRAERQMRVAEQRYRTIFENSAVAIMLADEQQRLISWNRFTEQLLCMTPEDLHHRQISSLYPPEEWQRIRALNLRRLGMQHHLETKMVRKDGQLVDVDISLSVLKDAEDRVIGSIGVVHDITEQKKAKESLERSFSLLHATLESTADGIGAFDNSGQLTSFNQKFLQMWGLTELAQSGLTRARIIEVIKAQVVDPQVVDRVLASAYSQPEQARSGVLELQDGRVIEYHCQPQRLAGQVTGRVWSFRDITERRRTLEALQQSEDRFRQVVENAQEWVWEVDADGLYTYVSPIVQQILGYSPDELVGRLHYYDLLDPDDGATVRRKLQEVFARQDAFKGLESCNRCKDGTSVWLASSGSPLFDRQGRLIGYRGVSVDITERRRLHEILDRKQRNLEAIFDAAPVGMLLVDSQTIVRRANDAIRQLCGKDYPQIINYLPGQALGCIYASSIIQDGTHTCGVSEACKDCALIATIRQALEMGIPVHGIEIQPTIYVDGKDVQPSLSVSCEPVIIDGAKYAVLSLHDITARVKAEKEMMEAMELKSQFISTVSHELRTPLASMKEAVLIVLDGVAGPINDDQRHFLDIAKRNIDRLWRLINDVLDFQKLHSGRMQFNMQPNDMTKAVEEAYTTMLTYASKRQIHMSFSAQPNLPKGTFDSDRVIQVVTNLLSNAIKFTPEGGKVTLDLSKQGEEFVIKVSDTGLGIPKEALPRIFERFYRVQRPGREIKGTGLGLAIVKAIVTAHGGRIEVESEVNKGTTFTVWLPVSPRPAPAPMPAAGDTLIEGIVSGH